MNYNGIYVASAAEITIAAGVLFEVQPPASNVVIEVIRAWISPAIGAAPLDLVQEIEIYLNDAVATGGTTMTVREWRGSGDAASTAAVLRGGTIGASPTEMYPDGFHQQNGWLFVPVPEARPRLVAGSGEDNWGIRIPTLRGTPVNSFGVLFGEVS